MQMSYLLSVYEESNKQNWQLIYVHVCLWVRKSGGKREGLICNSIDSFEGGT